MSTGSNIDLVGKLLRRRRLFRRVLTALVMLVAAAILLDRRGTFGYPGDDWSNFDQKHYVINHIADGDTVGIRRSGKEIRIRLLGVDAPEMSSHDHWATQATDYTQSRLLGQTVTLRLDGTETRDRYGRLLAYLYLSDTDNFNLDLVRDGQAYADRRFKHSQRVTFESAEATARKKETGLWKDLTEAEQPPWRRRWLENAR
jgi:micrococcal nuclease